MRKIVAANNLAIETVMGDITDQPDIDIIVNAANAQLTSGGGVAGAIHTKAGSSLAEECQQFAPIKPGQAIITSAHNLPNKYIIHCLGPVFGVDHPEEKLLASCYRSALNLAESYATNSIAFPAISTGIFGYPFADAASVCIDVIMKFNGFKNLNLIRMVLWRRSDYDNFNNVLNEKLYSHQHKQY